MKFGLEKVLINLKFVPIKEENMDFYQISSIMGLDYTYLRNNLYIENTNNEDLEFLSTLEKHDDKAKEFFGAIKISCSSIYTFRNSVY